MLSTDDCRRHLGGRGLSDAQLAEVRDALNAFALILVDEFLRGNLDLPPPDSHERSEAQ